MGVGSSSGTFIYKVPADTATVLPEPYVVRGFPRYRYSPVSYPEDSYIFWMVYGAVSIGGQALKNKGYPKNQPAPKQKEE